MVFQTICTTLEHITQKEHLMNIIDTIRVLALEPQTKTEELLLLDLYIAKAQKLFAKKGLVNFYGLKIIQMQRDLEDNDCILDLIKDMRKLSFESKYRAGLALTYTLESLQAHLNGNIEKSTAMILRAIKIVRKKRIDDPYIHYFVLFGYINHLWTSKGDGKHVKILAKCVYFFKKYDHKYLFIQSLLLLLDIYIKRGQFYEMAILQDCLDTKKSFEVYLPNDSWKQFSYLFFQGLLHIRCYKLMTAEEFLVLASDVAETIDPKIETNYLLLAMSQIITESALDCKIIYAKDYIEKSYKYYNDRKDDPDHIMIHEDFFDYTYTLVNFYISSRFIEFKASNYTDLIEFIFSKITHFYADPILLCEFIGNADLSDNQLKELLECNVPFFETVKYYIKLQLLIRKLNREESTTKSDQIIAYLEKERIKSIYNNTETGYMCATIARLLYENQKYKEIYDLLYPYCNSSDTIQVFNIISPIGSYFYISSFFLDNVLDAYKQFSMAASCQEWGYTKLEHELNEHTITIDQYCKKNFRVPSHKFRPPSDS